MTDTTERLRELAACPFCASNDVEVRTSITDEYIACCNCGSRTGVIWLGHSDAFNAGKRRKLVAAWNRRDTIDRLTAALAEANARADRAETARGEDGRLMSELTAERARADQMRKALQNIAAEAERENGGWVHLKRSIAINARAALATPPDPAKRAAALSDLAALDGESL